jgi:hypothetical protein
MLGSFQQVQLRLEIPASAQTLGQSLLRPVKFQEWLFPQQFSPQPLPDRLTVGTTYQSGLGGLQIHHQVERVGDHDLCLLLSGAIDGFHEWQWGDGWIQSRLEGLSLLPLGMGQSWGLWRLREFVKQTGQA